MKKRMTEAERKAGPQGMITIKWIPDELLDTFNKIAGVYKPGSKNEMQILMMQVFVKWFEGKNKGKSITDKFDFST